MKIHEIVDRVYRGFNAIAMKFFVGAVDLREKEKSGLGTKRENERTFHSNLFGF